VRPALFYSCGIGRTVRQSTFARERLLDLYADVPEGGNSASRGTTPLPMLDVRARSSPKPPQPPLPIGQRPRSLRLPCGQGPSKTRWSSLPGVVDVLCGGSVARAIDRGLVHRS
jgi:hypothetical protein